MQMQWEWRWKSLIFKTTVFSERYGLSFFGCILTIGAIYLFVTFGPNSHEQLKAENIVKHVVAWPVLLYLVRTTALSFLCLFCVTVLWNRHPSFKAVMLLLTQCWLKECWVSFTRLCVRSICQVHDLSLECAQMSLVDEHHKSFMYADSYKPCDVYYSANCSCRNQQNLSRNRSSDETCSFLLTVTCNFSWH